MKKTDLKLLIMQLLKSYEEVNILNIADKAKLVPVTATNRRAIQRALKELILEQQIIAKGHARARCYLLNSSHKPHYKNIHFINESTNNFHNSSKIIHSKKKLEYNSHFLKSYIPNESFYLSSEARNELFSEGCVENIVRPAGTYARHILNRLLIDLSWNSSRLEGNTYSLLETKQLIELGESAPGKNITEAQMILNHKEAIEYIIESAEEPIISSHEIFSVHALLSDNLLGDSSASGKLRNIAVGISGTTYTPLNNPHILKETFHLFIHKLNLIIDPFEQSFFALVHLSYLQAFEDVNKRTARLVANIPMIKKNLKPISFVDVDQQIYINALIKIYEHNNINLLRNLYIWAYKRSCYRYSAIQQSIGEPNLLKLKYRNDIQHIIRNIIIELITGHRIVLAIKQYVSKLDIIESDSKELCNLIESEMINLHDNNIARFKIKPSEFNLWKNANKF